MTPLKIKQIKKNPIQKEVFDIHHKISPKEFYDEQPNLIAQNKLISNCSRHAGGVVITDNTFQNMPVIKAKGGLQTPWPEGLNGRYLEDYGFLKFDILGLGTLRMFEETIKKILINAGNKNPSFKDIKEWYDKNLDSQNNNFDDINVYKHVFWDSNFSSVFQFVKTNVQSFMKRMKPNNINDIAIATSIFRPSGLSIGLDKIYLSNRENPSKVIYPDPLVKEVLGPTSGCLIFQEQTMELFHKLTGIPLEDTDNIRKALTKKDITNKEKVKKELEEIRKQFVTLSKEKNNIQENVTNKLFDDILSFASYGFNKCLSGDSNIETETGIKKIKDIKINERVNSVNGFIKVKNIYKNGIKQVYKIKTKNGKELICTLDHKIQTPSGMKTLKEILSNKEKIICKIEKNINDNV